MNDADKKLDLTKVLKRAKVPLSMNEILKKLGPAHKARTVRRWLAELVEQKIIVCLGRKRSTRYQWLSTMSEQPILSNASIAILDKIRRPVQARDPVNYHPEWLESYRPNKDFFVPETLRSQLQIFGALDYSETPAGTYARKIYNRLLIDLSYNSSRLEGNTYSLIDTQKLLLEGVGNDTKLDTERVMILNHKEAIEHLINKASVIEIDEQEICTLHFLLSDGLIAENYTGKMRDHAVRIGASTYLPMNSAPRLKTQLKKICQKASAIKDPYEQSFFLLTHVAYLQAFIDVNKRTSRLSANIPLIKNNLVPLSFNEVDKDNYTSAMIAVYELNKVQPLLELYADSYLKTCQSYAITAEAIGFDEYRVLYRQQRRAIVREIILQNLHEQALKRFVDAELKKLIPQAHQRFVLEDILEDLANIAPETIAGLGIAVSDLEAWLKL